MQAMVCEGAGRPLALRTLPRPEPGPGEVQIAVRACGVCRTDLHLVDGELPDPKVPVIPGHEIVGTVTAHGPGVTGPAVGRPGNRPLAQHERAARRLEHHHAHRGQRRLSGWADRSMLAAAGRVALTRVNASSPRGIRGSLRAS